ncbi:MAG: aminomethyltransferase family protein [Acidobacteriia bacterium]|nr:aminomethyltransferase family protein [Terriglobia bacterium]
MPQLTKSPLADYHLSQGATLTEYHGALVPARFSDPVTEHRAVREAAGLLDFSFRGKFALKGRDHARFLQRMVSNDVKKLTPGQGTYATFLDARGHIVADFRLYCAEDCFFADTDADLRDKAVSGLRRYVVGDQVSIEAVELYALAFQGPQARGLVEKTLHVDLPAMQEFDHFASNYAGFPIRVVRAGSTGEEGYEVWVNDKGLLALWGAACGQAPTYGMLPCGSEALESLRIEAGIPRYGPELGEDVIPLEAGLYNALSFTKGCYIGQEIVERARSRGHVNWKLMGLIVDSPNAPQPAEKVTADGKEIGEITSACVSPMLGKTLALAYLRREVAEPGTKLILASGSAAEVAALPFYQRATASVGA